MAAICPSTSQTKATSPNPWKRLTDVVSKILGDGKDEELTAHGGASFTADSSVSVHETQEELFKFLEQLIESC